MKRICVAILLAGSLLGCSKSGVDVQIDDLHQKALKDAGAAPEKEIPSTPATIGKAIRLEGLEVTPQSVELRNINGPTVQGRSFTNEGPYLVLTMFVKNVGQTPLKPLATLAFTDDMGVENDPAEATTVDGQVFDILPPGQQRIVTICAEEQNPRAKTYTLEATIVATDDEKNGRRKLVIEYQAPQIAVPAEPAAPPTEAAAPPAEPPPAK